MRRIAGVGLALAGLGLASGCDSPLARERIAHRERSLKWTAGALVAREQQNPERLKQDFDFLKRDEQKHEEMFARDLRQVKAYIDFDVKRWQERQDEYAKMIGETLRGEPESIAPNAIILFY